MPCYMIRAGYSGPVKIGKADDPEARMATFQNAHYETLRIIRLIDGGFPEETWLRRHYAALLIRGEWHHFCQTMMEVTPPVAVCEAISVGTKKSPAVLEALRKAGSVKALGELCGVTPQGVSQWERVPLDHVRTVAKLTGLPKHVIRPDVFDEPSKGEAA